MISVPVLSRGLDLKRTSDTTTRLSAAAYMASGGGECRGRYVGIDIEQVPVLVMALYLRDPADVLPLRISAPLMRP